MMLENLLVSNNSSVANEQVTYEPHIATGIVFCVCVVVVLYVPAYYGILCTEYCKLLLEHSVRYDGTICRYCIYTQNSNLGKSDDILLNNDFEIDELKGSRYLILKVMNTGIKSTSTI